MTAKQIELAQKLLALAYKGKCGEKTNAQALLNKYLEKHGLTLADIDSEKINEYYIDLGKDNEKRKFFCQIVSSVGGDEIDMFAISELGIRALNLKRFRADIQRPKLRIKSIVMQYNCTTAERAEILSSFEFYWDEYQRQKKIFYSAFIHKQRLYMNPYRMKDVEEKEQRKLTREDQETLRMAEGIERKTKQLRLS